MAERLIIRLDEDDAVEWLVLDEHNNRIGAIQRGGIDTLAQQAAGRRVIVFVPGEQVTLSGAKLPSQNAQKIAQALPYALEERLAEDIDQLHFAAAGATTDGHRDVAVARRAAMDNWLARLSDAGLRADALLPDTLLPPSAANQWTIAIEGDRVLVRTAAASGFAADKAMAEALVALKLSQLHEAARPEIIVIHAADPADPDVAALADACTAAGADVPQVETLPEGTAMSLAGAGLPAAGGFTLLQGDYRPRRDWEQRWRRWRLAAVLAGAWLIVAASWQGVDYYRMHQQEARLNEAIAALFHKAMPDARMTADPRGRLQSRLSQLRAASGNGPHNGLLSMLGALAGGIGTSTQVTTLSWHNGVLDLQVTSPNPQTLGDLRARLASETGLDVQIEQVSAEGKNVNGRLRIGAPS